MSTSEDITDKFIDPFTNKSFSVKRVQLKNGQMAQLVPLWVKSTPSQWIKDELERDP